jgi:hypothetical protein
VRRRWDEVGAALQRAIVLGQRWDEVADALEGADVLRQLADLARVPEETRVEFCRRSATWCPTCGHLMPTAELWWWRNKTKRSREQ